MPPHVTDSHRMSQTVTECHRQSQTVTACHRMSPHDSKAILTGPMLQCLVGGVSSSSTEFIVFNPCSSGLRALRLRLRGCGLATGRAGTDRSGVLHRDLVATGRDGVGIRGLNRAGTEQSRLGPIATKAGAVMRRARNSGTVQSRPCPIPTKVCTLPSRGGKGPGRPCSNKAGAVGSIAVRQLWMAVGGDDERTAFCWGQIMGKETDQ